MLACASTAQNEKILPVRTEPGTTKIYPAHCPQAEHAISRTTLEKVRHSTLQPDRGTFRDNWLILLMADRMSHCMIEYW